jgi:hypothetical protein
MNLTENQSSNFVQSILKKFNITYDILYWDDNFRDNITAIVYLYKDLEVIGNVRGYKFNFNYDSRFNKLTYNIHYPDIENHKSFMILPPQIVIKFFLDKVETYLRNYIGKGYTTLPKPGLAESNLVRRVINEETSGLGDFIETLKSKFDMSDELVDFVVKFIEKSDCQKIEFSEFKYPALGAALHNGVLINVAILNRPLGFALFVIFHEIAHQYQYKKYGIEKMNEFYNDEISVVDTAKFMKTIETTADNFASRKIRELQGMGLIDEKYVPIEMYKTVPESRLVAFIEDIRSKLRERNITSPDDISKFYYNLIKNNL